MVESAEIAAGRQRMIDTLRERGLSETVLAAMERTPRHRFVPRFVGPKGADGERSEWTVTDSTTDTDAIELAYHPDRGLGLRFDDRGSATSTISAPALVGWTLQSLELTPGMRVLEIGTASGWNAALLAEMVGPSGEVVSVEIDEALARSAAERLGAEGRDRVTVVAGDAYADTPPGPFDRIVATVGCIDIAPKWLAGLSQGGFAVIPLLHGSIHPTMRVTRQGGVAHAVALGHSAFVAVSGRQAHRRPAPWSIGASTDLSSEDETGPLPADLAAAVVGDGGKPLWTRIADFAYFVALEDTDRATGAALRYFGLGDGDRSFAVIDAVSGELRHGGAEGPTLRAQVCEIGSRWLERGAPELTAFRSVWRGETAARPSRGWLVERVDYRQIVTLGS